MTEQSVVSLGPWAIPAGITQATADLIAEHLRAEWDAVTVNPHYSSDYLLLRFYRGSYGAKVLLLRKGLESEPQELIQGAEELANRMTGRLADA